MISGKVDYLRKNTIAGWVNSTSQERAEVRVTIRGECHVTRADIERTGAKTPATVFGFRLVLPEDFTAAALFDGTLVVEAAQDGETVPLGIWDPLAIAAKLDALDPAMLQRALVFLEPGRRALLEQALVAKRDPAPAETVAALLKPADFDEEFYLETHPDVRTAVVRGSVQSGFHHYTLYGRAEGRQLMLARPPKS